MNRDLDGIVLHVTTGDAGGWRQALRNLSNLYDDDSLPILPDLITVVVNGGPSDSSGRRHPRPSNSLESPTPVSG